MNESLLGCLVWAVFFGLVTLASDAIQFLCPHSGAWAPFAALAVVLVAWLAILFGSMLWSRRTRR